ncbi:MAG TPA: S8 family peptidase [Candidatus Thermoplasmatota archaeon]|nr:S8 family peptidase [Candidatus Thermoplasmatota archaeon]
MLRGALLAFCVLAPSFGLAALGTAGAPWWRSTSLDLDGNGLDDALELDLALGEPLVVLVAFATTPTAADRAAIVDAGYTIVHAYEHFDVVAVRALPETVPRLLDVPGVVFVERSDTVTTLLKDSVPLIGAPQVWRTYGSTGKGIVVAVIDDGAYEQHPDLTPKVAGSFDAALSGNGGVVGAMPASLPVLPAGLDGHGTHVAGTIVSDGGQSGGTYRGVAPDAKFVDVKVFSGPNQTSSDVVLRGLDWVISNADRLHIRVATMSLGGRVSDGKDALSRAVNVAVDDGIIVVAAAGNAGPGPGTVSSPGAAEKAITVGAVDKSKRIAPYSSRGPLSDGRIKPEVVAPGTAITSTVPPASTTSALSLLRGGRGEVYYGALSGTSMAAPHVAGVIALMLQVNPELGPFEVKQILVATAQDMSVKGPDGDTGYGFVNAIAATQVADDPTLLGSPQFASVLRTLPEPPKESFADRMAFEYERAVREGKLPVYVGLAIGVVSLLVTGGVVGTRAILRPRP